ncbi:MAG: MqnA/MqnD/SBP family protein [Planctomycetota bacterium]|nr:MqnA/MqnD/SBP family protein [Planctomycetota bacterium]
MTSIDTDARAVIRLGHSPDPDDAFMWWPLFERDGAPAPLSSARFRFEQVVEDIEALNQLACEASDDDALEITGISCACYPLVADRYAITACGASLGDGYGPRLVASGRTSLEELAGGRPSIAVPGERTTAYLVSRLIFADTEVDWKPMLFSEIPAAVAAGQVEAGVVIHEGQLTYEEDGLHELLDLGVWWQERTRLPLPLGANVIRRGLDQKFGAGATAEIVGLLQRSLNHAMEHREESIARAKEWGRGIDDEVTGTFVDMYVNRWTLDYGPTGRSAVISLLDRAAREGLLPACPDPEFLSA